MNIKNESRLKRGSALALARAYHVWSTSVAIVSYPGAVPRKEEQGGRPQGPVKSPPPVAPKKVQDKAVICQIFQKACSALVVILMLSCFLTF